MPWWFSHYVWICRVDPERLTGRPCETDQIRSGGHKYRNAPSIRILIKSICMAFSGLLRWNTMLSVIRVSAATAVLSWNDRKF